MSMISAGALTRLVAEARPPPVAQYRGLSDHRISVGRFVPQNPDVPSFLLGTFNALNPFFVKNMNNFDCDEYPFPGIGPKDLSQGAGLDKSLCALPELYHERWDRVLEMILDFMQPFRILCIQECWKDLELQLSRHCAGRFEMFAQAVPLSKKSYNLTLVGCGLREYVTLGASTERSLTVKFTGNDVLIHNVHLPFKTADAHATVKECLAMEYGAGHLFVGDFNVQTQPLNPEIIREGVNTETLEEFVKHYLPVVPSFLPHPEHWTNWNVRKNCVVPERNWDHFDNIMWMTICDSDAKFWRLVEPISVKPFDFAEESMTFSV